MTPCPAPAASASMRRVPPPITADALRALLASPDAPGTLAGVAARLGWTKAGLYYKRRDGTYQHPELVAVLQAHFAAERKGPDPRRKGQHNIALSPETVARLDTLCAARALVVGPKRASRSAVARELLEQAVDPLPAPEPGGRWGKVKLDLGPAWDALAARLGTTEPEQVVGVVRAILGRNNSTSEK